jgi:thiamine-monophosphate kinase
MNLRDLGEFGLIRREAARLDVATPACGEVILGIGDDAAVLRLPEGYDLVTTTDALIEDVHFRCDWSRPEDIGWKSLAVNVSDLGAMGARPLGAAIALALPAHLPVRWIDRFFRGLSECASFHGCPVVGGDTVRSPGPIAITVSAHGGVRRGKAVLRSGARTGDLICVTGTLGESGAGLALLEAGRASDARWRPLISHHCRPRPPAAAGVRLGESGIVTAMMDLSDGLAADLTRLCDVSRCGALVKETLLPISDLVRQTASSLGVLPTRRALFGGEDYQLLFTVRPERFGDVPPLLGPLGVTATVVGEIRRGKARTLLTAAGERRPLKAEGFAHF